MIARGADEHRDRPAVRPRALGEQPVWSVVCFFTSRSERRTGVTTALLKAAVEHAAKRGARIVEGYPLDPHGKRLADAFAWFGLASAFQRAGFKEVARRSKTRPIMRYVLRAAQTAPRVPSRSRG